MSKDTQFPTPEVIPDGHAFAETRNLRPRDQRLRRQGFRIFSRPNAGPAIWTRQGKLFTEPEAHLACAELERIAAEREKG